MLLTIDESWKEHLREMDQLRQSVQNASYEQKDPLVIYKVESFNMFKQMVGEMNAKTVSILMRGQIPVQQEVEQNVQEREMPQRKPRYQESRGGGCRSGQRARTAGGGTWSLARTTAAHHAHRQCRTQGGAQ